MEKEKWNMISDKYNANDWRCYRLKRFMCTHTHTGTRAWAHTHVYTNNTHVHGHTHTHMDSGNEARTKIHQISVQRCHAWHYAITVVTTLMWRRDTDGAHQSTDIHEWRCCLQWAISPPLAYFIRQLMNEWRRFVRCAWWGNYGRLYRWYWLSALAWPLLYGYVMVYFLCEPLRRLFSGTGAIYYFH